MMGRYFARFDESPTRIVKKGNGYVKRRTGRETDPVFDTVSVQQYFAAAV